MVLDFGADYYFNKSVKDLTIAESAFLAGINHSPIYYNPYLNKGVDVAGKKFEETDEEFEARKNKTSERIKERAKTVTWKMNELGYITKEELEEADKQINEGLVFKKGTASESTVQYTSIVDAAITEAISIYMEKYDVKKEVAELAINNGGMKIYTTQDSEKQEKMEAEMKKSKYVLKSRKNPGKTAQAAGIIIDHKTGEILVAVGGLRRKY